MKAKRISILLMLIVSMAVIPAKAIGLGDLRINARFLTDRMAFELNLDSRQYDALYEINYDFLNGVDGYVDELGYADSRAMEAYYRYLDERNDDLRWILSRLEYERFMRLDYFYRPLYLSDNRCTLRIYSIYPNRTHFYYDRPSHYYSYRGAHSRRYFRGNGYYRNFYRHDNGFRIYGGNYRVAREHWSRDFSRDARRAEREYYKDRRKAAKEYHKDIRRAEKEYRKDIRKAERDYRKDNRRNGRGRNDFRAGNPSLERVVEVSYESENGHAVSRAGRHFR